MEAEDRHSDAATPLLGLSREQSFQLYTPTTLPNLSIRILVLHAAADSSAPIVCSLEPGTLLSLAGTYDALSYAWGADEATVPITCNDLALFVRPNLEAVLRKLRRPHFNRRLWIDFLCINQADLAERGRQVACMFDVYAQSAQVILWLGEASASSGMVMKYIRDLDAVAESKEYARFRNRQKVLNPRPHVLAHQSETPASQDEAISWPLAVGEFLARPWFRRCWVQQEAAACARTVVQCGDERVDWDHLFAFAWRMMRGQGQFTPAIAEKLRAIPAQAMTSLPLVKLIHTNRQIHAESKRSRPSLLHVLHSARGCEAADPRDRIYAVQHLARQGSANSVYMAPNYDITMPQLCVQFAERYILQRGLAILAFAGRATQDPSRAKALPSWVPDWENAARHHFKGSGREKASGGRQVCGRIEPDARTGQLILIAEGFILGDLKTLSGTIDSEVLLTGQSDEVAYHEKLPALAALEQKTYDLLIRERSEARYRGQNESLHEAYTRTITADSAVAYYKSKPLAQQCKEWQASLSMQLSQEEHVDSNEESSPETVPERGMLPADIDIHADDIDVDTDYALNVHKTGTYTRLQLARTSRGGWLVLAPKIAREGDLVALINGMSRGVVLRELLGQRCNVDVADMSALESATSELHVDEDGVLPVSATRPALPRSRQRYELLGECYVHGAMEGQMAPSLKRGTDWKELEII